MIEGLLRVLTMTLRFLFIQPIKEIQLSVLGKIEKISIRINISESEFSE